MTRRETKAYPIAGLKSIDTETGAFEAVVSVFGNVDLHGHRIDPAAFDGSIARWQASGDPIPVIFSHQWDDLSSYLGTIDPDNVRALQPGDPELPDAIKDYGGLFVAGELDTTEPEGRKAAKLLKSRAVREFSFAYDVLDEAKADDGYLDLLELDVLEIGPTLKGANPLTQLVSAKSAGADFDEAFETVAAVFGMKAAEVAELIASVEALAEPKSDDPETAGRAAKLKAWVRYEPDGTIEAFLSSVRDAIIDEALARFAAELYTVAVEGTYSDPGRVLFYVELWDDPIDGGTYYEADYTVEGETVTLGEWAAVELTVSAQPKSRRGVKVGARNSTADAGRIQGIHDLTRELGAECAAEEPDGAGDDDPDDEETGTNSIPAPGVLRVSLDTELAEID